MFVDLSPPSGPGGQPPAGGGGEPPARDIAAAHLADLMTKCATADQAAFAELYDLTKSRVFGIVLKVLRSLDHAQEVTQEVYIEVWRHAPTYQADKGSVLAWMATMAHRRAVDRVRSVTSEIARDERYAAIDAEPDNDEVWDSVAHKYDVDRVRQAMATLTRIQREALQLAYYDGLTQSEIAKKLNLPLGTVKTRIRDGLKRLGEALGGVES